MELMMGEYGTDHSRNKNVEAFEQKETAENSSATAS